MRPGVSRHKDGGSAGSGRFNTAPSLCDLGECLGRCIGRDGCTGLNDATKFSRFTGRGGRTAWGRGYDIALTGGQMDAA